jgi:hypothetical protein
MARKLIAEIESSHPEVNPKSPDIAVPFPRGLTLARAADYSSLTVWMLRTLVWNQTIPAQMQGKRIIILREHLDKFLTEAQRTNSINEHLRLRNLGVFKRKAARSKKGVGK